MIFDFGRKQRLGVRLQGNTSGKEMFKIDDYNNRKKNTAILSFIVISILSVFYFFWNNIESKIRIFMILVVVGCLVYGYFNVKEQIRMKERI
ncbi:MAG: hypothetical protein M0R17_05990 [Candidatus Omnitrophica bacterium]|jgi:uncharacterized membrane protein|nr:hypothetical protein [Candidatus Omnitrophota bacterium]